MTEWQPIETAPKDGTEVLVSGFAYNDPTKDRWQQVASWSSAEWATDHAPLYPPTHWMPLPPPPAQDK